MQSIGVDNHQWASWGGGKRFVYACLSLEGGGGLCMVRTKLIALRRFLYIVATKKGLKNHIFFSESPLT